MRAAANWIDKHNLDSVRLLGTVGEPINPEAWMWYRNVIGHDKCPIVDTWWQTETGAMMITPIPGVTPTKPGTATLPFFGIDAAIVDRSGKELAANQGGLLVIRKPWPSMFAASSTTRRVMKSNTGRTSQACTSPAIYALAAMRTATSGSWAASTTS